MSLSSFNLAAFLATKNQTATRSPHRFPPQWDGQEKQTKGKTHGLKERQSNRTTKKIQTLVVILQKIMIIIKIIMSMQNKLYTIQFHHLTD